MVLLESTEVRLIKRSFEDHLGQESGAEFSEGKRFAQDHIVRQGQSPSPGLTTLVSKQEVEVSCKEVFEKIYRKYIL